MIVLDEKATTEALPFSELITAIGDLFATGCHVPLRHNHPIIDDENTQHGTLLLMPAWTSNEWLAVKTVSIFPENGKFGLPGLHSVVILYSAKTGAPAAILNGDVVTSRRTAASSALAARFLARENARTLLVLGSGRVAELLPLAYRSVRPIERVLLWNRNLEKAEKLAPKLNAYGFATEVVNDLAAACGRADIISSATLSTEPLILREWLKAGVHVDLIGGFTPTMRETDDACFADTAVFVDTEEALMKAGDLLSPLNAGVFAKEKVRATLAELCRGAKIGRQNDAEITVFKSVGTALEDLAAAILAFSTHQKN